MADAITIPRELTPELIRILGIPNFGAGPIARAFRDAGRAEIKRRSEDEQAFVLHWLLGLYADHGAAWEGKADEILKQVVAEAKARATAAVRPN